MAGSGNEQGQMITGINVTPLVDVVLVLLIIFMATAPLIQKRVMNVSVPRAARSEPKATATLQLLLSLDRVVYLEQAPFTPAQLSEELKARLRTDPGLYVSVAADKGVPYGEVVDLLDVVRAAGVKKVALDVQAKPA